MVFEGGGGVTQDPPSRSAHAIMIIRIYHKCEGRIEKSVPRIAVWHHEEVPEVPEYAKIQFHIKTLLDVLGKTA